MAGTVTVIHEDSPDAYTVAQTVPTAFGARTITLDPATGRLFRRREGSSRLPPRQRTIPGRGARANPARSRSWSSGAETVPRNGRGAPLAPLVGGVSGRRLERHRKVHGQNHEQEAQGVVPGDPLLEDEPCERDEDDERYDLLDDLQLIPLRCAVM